jgi:hypothetical protein
LVAGLTGDTLTLTQGDLLYVPRGVVHEATTAGFRAPSLHLTLGIEGSTHFSFQMLLHYCARSYLASPALPPTALMLTSDSAELSVSVSASSTENLLQVLVHCAASDSPPLRAPVPMTESLDAGHFNKTRALVLAYGLRRALACAANAELLLIEVVDGWRYSLLEPLPKVYTKPSANLGYFMSSQPVVAITGLGTAAAVLQTGMQGSFYLPEHLSSLLDSQSWSHADTELMLVLESVLHLGSAVVEEFSAAAQTHRRDKATDYD